MTTDHVTPIPLRKVSAAELLQMREEFWARKLRGLSLVAELDVKEAHRRQVCGVLGRTYTRWAGTPRAKAIFDRWPACVVVATTAIASRDYRRGGLWPQLWDELGHDGDSFDQTVWGHGFRRALTRLELPTFENTPLHYLGPILMHAGIPDYCLDDYFKLLDHRRAIDPDLDTETFFQWATSRENRLNVLDKPASRFLIHGSEYAFDFVDRTFDLLDRLRAGSSHLDGVGLPLRVVNRAAVIAASGLFEARLGRVSWGSARATDRPRVGLDPFNRGIQVVLPSVRDAPGGFVSWTVTADGHPYVVESQAQWAGVAEAPPPTQFALPHPVRNVAVSTTESKEQAELRVIDPDNPLLLFGENGRRLPAHVPLPPDVVWVVHPESNDLVVDGPLTVVVEGQLPLGWNGWCLRQLNLDGVRSLELEGLPNTCRLIRGHARPRINTTSPLAGVSTPYGTPVYTEVPEIWLPADRAAQTTWGVEIRRSDGSARVFETFSTDEPKAVTELWDRLPRPLLGSFDIAVRGPLGRGVTRSIFLAESLGVHYIPAVRSFGPGGLASGRAELVPAIGGHVSPRILSFKPTEQASVVEYRAGSETEPLVITPPRVQVMLERAGAPNAWSAGPLRIVADAFSDDPGVLLVRDPGMTATLGLRVVTGDKVIQEVPSSGRTQAGIARFELIRIADTVAAHQHVELVCDAAGGSLLARVRPRHLARGLERVADVLRLRDAVQVEGLTAGLYLTAAPWRKPVAALVGVEGEIVVPPELRDAGPLLVALQVDDPWAPRAWPRWPSDGLWVAGSGHLVSEDRDESALSRFAARLRSVPDNVSDLRMVWELLNTAPRLYLATEAAQVAGQCAELLRRHPQRAVTALAELGLSPAEVGTAVIGSGLAGMQVTPDVETAARLWPTAPLLGALFGNLDQETVCEAAVAQCGNTVQELRTAGHDPSAMVGRFGREAAALVAMQPQQLEGLWKAAQIIPKALLDPDTRAVAARRLFDRRASDGVRQIGGMASGVVRNALSVLKDRPRLCAQIEARRSDGGAGEWLSLPAASAALAIVARRAARGDVRCQRMEQLYRAQWRRFAMCAPDLVIIDLVLAELLVGLESTEI